MINLYAQQINLWAVLVGALLGMVVGYLWYMVLLGDLWTKENKFTEEYLKTKSPSALPYVIMFGGQLVFGLALAWFLKATVADTYFATLRIVLAVWGAFTFVPFLSTYMFSWRGWKLTLIDSGYYLVSFLVTGSLLFFWK